MSHAYRNGNYYSEVAKIYEPWSMGVGYLAFLCGVAILAYDFRFILRWFFPPFGACFPGITKGMSDEQVSAKENVTVNMHFWFWIVISEMCIAGSMFNGFFGSGLCRTQGGFFMFFSRFSWMYTAFQGFSMIFQYYSTFWCRCMDISDIRGSEWILYITSWRKWFVFSVLTVLNFTLEMVPFMSTKVHAEYGVDDEFEYETACSMDFSRRWKRWTALFYVGPLVGCVTLENAFS